MNEPSQAGHEFKDLIHKIAPGLKPEGFSKDRQSFHTMQGANWGLINFQRSVKSSQVCVIFTINLGVCSGRLFKFSGRRLAKKPAIEDCHWQERLGELLGQGDKWWTIEAGASIERLAPTICDPLVKRGIPEIQKYLSDESLRDLWLSGASPGLNQFERLKYLSVLLKAIGPTESLEPVLNELLRITEGQMAASTARYHVKRIRTENPK